MRIIKYFIKSKFFSKSLGYLMFLIMIGTTTDAYADSYIGQVTMLEVWASGNTAFVLSTQVTGCNGQFIINASSPGAKIQLSTVLAAKLSGKQISVSVSQCGPADNYGGNYNIPAYIYLED